MRRVFGWIIVIIAYIQCINTIVYFGIFAAIAGIFNIWYFLLGIFGSLCLYVLGLWIRDGSEIFRKSGGA